MIEIFLFFFSCDFGDFCFWCCDFRFFFVVILVVVAVNLLRKQCIRNEKERETDREIVIVSVSGRSHFS